MPQKPGPEGQVAAPPPAPMSALAPGPGIRVALDVRGWAVVALPDRLVVLDDDFRHLRGFDPVTGAELWRVQAQSEPRGWHTLYAVGDRVLLHAGSDLVAVDARRGELVATHPARVFNGSEDACRLDIWHGFDDRRRRWTPDDPALTACAAACTCTRRLFRCDTGAPIGKPFNGNEIYLHDELEESASMLCVGAPNWLGRIGGKYLLGVRAGPDAYEGIAVDGEGKVLWRRPELSAAVEPYRRFDGDVAADACWSIDSTSMVAWTCSTGQIRWQAQFPGEQKGYSGEAHVVAPGLLLVRRRSESELQVELRDVTTGKQRWRRTLPPDRVALAPGENTDVLAYAHTTTYAWLDLRKGATLREHTIAPDQSMTRDPASDGYIRLGGPEVALLSREGEVLQTVPKATPGIQWLGAGFVAGREERRFTVLRRPDFAVALAVEGAWLVEDSSAALGPAAVVLLDQRGQDEPLRIVVLRSD
ncbi:PQQ-binding-like beta-propeller repeat protein [Nannocystis sp. RBIL2]|uniref:outer membrane protein assembly factor BamB family protein n=1 Tax=Nannocystis sp. RBIL2 TaxID=2996788 RepID=UPI00226FB412|nr:PQQ-binding-like beta-propeller repeat protein [Nannocystis sp. RBIL2]MCY1068793.1 PQQ-binding-like beta-propeller repeat protein [Nannocystis sp. RBIL2]